MKAVASVTFDDQFVVHDIKVIEGQSGMFIAMPSRKTPMANIGCAHPINSGTRTRSRAHSKNYELGYECFKGEQGPPLKFVLLYYKFVGNCIFLF